MISAPQRRSLLAAALGFALLEGHAAGLLAVRSWLSTWSGIGNVIAGMHRQGYDIQLTQYDERGWRATFYVTGMEHSATSSAPRRHVGANPVASGATCGVRRSASGIGLSATSCIFSSRISASSY
jgi:hypothetical protein